MTMVVVNLLEAVQVHHEQRQGPVFQRIPRDLVAEVIKEETAVIDTGELVFEDQARRICADMLKKMQKIFVFHTKAGSRALHVEGPEGGLFMKPDWGSCTTRATQGFTFDYDTVRSLGFQYDTH